MSIAVTVSRTETPSPCIEADCTERYLHAIAAQLAAALREVGPQLVMPRAVNADRALRVLDHFIETMTGLALGAIAAHLTAGMRRWFGDDGVATMHAALHGWAPYEKVATDGTAAEQLHVRFSLASKHARALVAGIPARPRIAAMFAELAHADAIRDRVAHELALGWRVYTAAVTTKRYPPLDRLWQAWVWQLDGKPALTRDDTALAGYITLVR